MPELAAQRSVLPRTCAVIEQGLRERLAPWDEIIAEICAAPLQPGWVPGERCAYHVASGWYILAEVIRRLDGRDYRRYVREAIFEPLGMTDSWIGMPPQRHREYGDRIAPMHATEVEPIPHPYWPWAGSEDACALCRPGGSAWGPAHQLGRFYETLLAGGAGPGGADPAGGHRAADDHPSRQRQRAFCSVSDPAPGWPEPASI